MVAPRNDTMLCSCVHAYQRLSSFCTVLVNPWTSWSRCSIATLVRDPTSCLRMPNPDPKEIVVLQVIYVVSMTNARFCPPLPFVLQTLREWMRVTGVTLVHSTSGFPESEILLNAHWVSSRGDGAFCSADYVRSFVVPGKPKFGLGLSPLSRLRSSYTT